MSNLENLSYLPFNINDIAVWNWQISCLSIVTENGLVCMWGGVSYKQHTLDLATVQLKFQNRINVCVHYYMLQTGILLTSSPPLFHMHYWATTRTTRNTCALQFHVSLMWISRIFIEWYSYNSTKFVLKQNYKGLHISKFWRASSCILI
jgi:hypothetical protein